MFHPRLALFSLTMALALSAAAQTDHHGRKYTPPPPLGHIVLTLQKATNHKPVPNAAVVFHVYKNGVDNGNLEIKADPDGRATIDLIEVGSHVTVQVIATGFATYATEFDVPAEEKDVLVELLRPRQQVSAYGDTSDKPAEGLPGVQEPHHAAPATGTPPAPAAPTTDPTKPTTSTPQ